MTSNKHGIKLMVSEHLLTGEPLTRLEALILYGVQQLHSEVHRLRREGWIVNSRKITYAEALRRINKHVVVRTPKNLPVQEILITDYWLSK